MIYIYMYTYMIYIYTRVYIYIHTYVYANMLYILYIERYIACTPRLVRQAAAIESQPEMELIESWEDLPGIEEVVREAQELPIQQVTWLAGDIHRVNSSNNGDSIQPCR